MKAYITKYALTKGIYEVEAEVCSDISEEMIRVIKDKNGNKPYGPTHYHGDDWHKDKESAMRKADIMKEKKIAALQKKITQLSKLSFK